MYRVASLYQNIHNALPTPSAVPRSVDQQERYGFADSGRVPNSRFASRGNQWM